MRIWGWVEGRKNVIEQWWHGIGSFNDGIALKFHTQQFEELKRSTSFVELNLNNKKIVIKIGGESSQKLSNNL